MQRTPDDPAESIPWSIMILRSHMGVTVGEGSQLQKHCRAEVNTERDQLPRSFYLIVTFIGLT